MPSVSLAGPEDGKKPGMVLSRRRGQAPLEARSSRMGCCDCLCRAAGKRDGLDVGGTAHLG